MNQYNHHAAKLRRPKLSFDKVIEHDFISEFDLLRDGRQDIRAKPWAETNNRLLRDTFYKVERAREEIARLNVEIGRLRGWMSAEQSHYANCLTLEQDPFLAAELKRRLIEMRKMHVNVERHLSQCESLGGYTGPIASNIEEANDEEEGWESDAENNHIDDVVQVLENMGSLG